jgi:hypothetical protein
VIPELDKLGLLPPGVWTCTLAEVSSRFATTPHRRRLWEGMQRFISGHLPAVPGVAGLYIDGSFTTDKARPSDIDIVADLSCIEQPDALLQALRARLQHSQLKRTYGVDFWIKHPELPNDLAAFFQQIGDRKAAQLGLHPTHPKGILKVHP